MMKTFALISVFLSAMLPFSNAASSSKPQAPGQQILQQRLFAAHHDDPVEVVRLVDPVYAATLDEPRLVEVLGSAMEPTRIWVTEGEKLRLRKRGASFVDLTGHEHFFTSNAFSNNAAEWPRLQHQERVTNVIKRLKVEDMMGNLGNLTNFYNRYYRSEHGAQSARWIYDKVEEIIADAPPDVRLSLEAFAHAFPQITVIARFEPARLVPRPNDATIVLGSHLDSANYESPLLSAPGADDGGSGTVTLLEAFRALVQAGFKPAVPVEFHWYAAEEGGLLGSLDVVSEYVRRRKAVGAMMQFDMTAYVHADTTPTMTFITNDVDASLTVWAMDLAGAYSTSPVTGATLFTTFSPGGVSDHLSWHRAGVPVVCATESDPSRTPNPYIHTVHDRTVVEKGEFSFAYAVEFAKVAIGFAVELGGWDD